MIDFFVIIVEFELSQIQKILMLKFAATLTSSSNNISSSKVLTSIYIKNSFTQDATITQVSFVVPSQTAPLTVNNLNILVPAQRNIYSQGSITSFDVTNTNNNIQSFNGIQSIMVGGNLITFNDMTTGSSAYNPIKITQQNGTWVQALN